MTYTHSSSHRHYIYQLSGEYATVSTPRGGWIKPSRYINDEVSASRPVGYYPSSVRPNGSSPKRNRKCLILSQSMVIDVDPTKVREGATSGVP